MQRRNPHFRYDLVSILKGVAGICIALALMMSGGSEGSWVYEFSQLPSNDQQLRIWLQDQGLDHIQVERLPEGLRLSWSVNVIESITRDVYVPPHVPWVQLGYSFPDRQSGTSHFRMLSAPARVWLAVIAACLLFVGLRRWFVRTKQRT